MRPLGGRFMSAFLQSSRALVLAALWAASPAAADTPQRVVSINLCTDQLAMMLAAPGQLISVSHLASDPLSSSMVAQAAAYPPNRGGAEQVFLMHPDLVLAGTYSARASVDLLRILGVEVVEVPIVQSIADVSAALRLVGRAIGREAAAEALALNFEAEIAALSPPDRLASAAMYYANGYTTGAGTLSDQVLSLTGFRNIGAEAGVTGGGILPLERLVMADPEMIVISTPYPGASRAEEILHHPALLALRGRAGATFVSDADWVCGTPYLLRAIAQMQRARSELGE